MIPGPAFDELVVALPRECAALILEPPRAMSWISIERAAVDAC